MIFPENYENIKNLAASELETIENILIEEIKTREPLCSALKNFLQSPSKRIRSILAILYAKALGVTLSDNQLEFLSVIELIHNASLIHDDVIDESKFRRGKKSMWKDFDNKIAVISGDYILSVAMEKLLKIGNNELIQNVIKTIKNMCIGEINQNFNRYKTVTIEEYIEKTKNKTGYLFDTAVTGTIMLCDNNFSITDAKNLGLNTGIAFQIRDDFLNFTNSKDSDNDYEQGIYNAPVILGDKKDKYRQGVEKTILLLDDYIKRASNIVQNLPENDYKNGLTNLLELLKNV